MAASRLSATTTGSLYTGSELATAVRHNIPLVALVFVDGAFGNVRRYIKNPIKDPIGAFEGILEFIGEFSRLVAVSFRLFGNAFAGEVLLMVIGVLTGYLASVALPFFMAFELFIGFIQAYVFFVLTLIFTSLAIQTHGHDEPNKTSLDHSPVDTTKKAAQLE